MTGIQLAATTLGVVGSAAVLALVVRSWARLRGPRVVTCPETRAPAAVHLDLPYAVLGAALGRPHFRLRDCSRWPEKAGCGQMCLSEIDEAPEDCLLRRIVRQWYADKACAYCGRAVGDIRWHDHRPALRSPGGSLLEWKDVEPEEVPRLLNSHRAVCWNCLIAESFRRDHVDLVIDRSRPSTHLTR